ncbi:NADPH-dependent FMN reductase [Ornithinibacillus halotolerans]|uniref:FMN reductase n=1 Tax=Ornithinibacillus halotolerans TaxID=1274357 RepID=A0A916S991_9BACI|nr:NAD(P)H-dependent oxidoreductase [Ornithinibacillus halotolerans]GGA89587.1 FMN reductase [Ornithinibacillus halotolerans]
MGFWKNLFGKSTQEDAVKPVVEPLKVAVVLGSVREGRNGAAVANWMLNFAKNRNDESVVYELVDLANYNIAFLGSKKSQTEEAQANAKAWSEKMASYDGYIFVTPEYNHAIGGALKNALDYLNPEVNNKVAGFVGYGSLGGTRAHENLRLILGELQVADVRTAVTFSLISDFENMSVFKPADYHADNANEMLNQVITWGRAFKELR